MDVARVVTVSRKSPVGISHKQTLLAELLKETPVNSIGGRVLLGRDGLGEPLSLPRLALLLLLGTQISLCLLNLALFRVDLIVVTLLDSLSNGSPCPLRLKRILSLDRLDSELLLVSGHGVKEGDTLVSLLLAVALVQRRLTAPLALDGVDNSTILHHLGLESVLLAGEVTLSGVAEINLVSVGGLNKRVALQFDVRGRVDDTLNVQSREGYQVRNVLVLKMQQSVAKLLDTDSGGGNRGLESKVTLSGHSLVVVENTKGRDGGW